MNLNNTKIGSQLFIGLVTMLILVIILGVVAYIQTNKIHQQTEDMYNHPLVVRRSIGLLESDVYAIHRDMKDIFISTSDEEISQNINQIEIWKANAFEQIDILYKQYLGPKADVDSIRNAFIKWNSMREETLRLLRQGNIKEAANRTRTHGVAGNQVLIITDHIKKVDDFSKNKGEQLYYSSKDLLISLNWQLMLFIFGILVFSIIIFYYLIRNIRRPLALLNDATNKFQDGDLNSRCTYKLKNEFGVLTDSFNSLAESVKLNSEVSDKTEKISKVMLSQDDSRIFFSKTLQTLSEYTHSQLAAVYLLSDDRKSYIHFESIGTDENARTSFDARLLDGEFGSAVSSQKIQHIKGISEDTRFKFNTVSGNFIPHEIVTIPIISGNETIAIISLASLKAYSKKSIRFIENIFDTMCARVEGVLAYRKIKEFSEKLGIQNSELEVQKNELSAQSAELSEQNSELEMQKLQLDEANRLKTSFLSNMSHELRTPLNSVIALTGVLNRRLAKKISEEEYGYLEVIERNGKHLLSLINDILDISRIEAGKEEIEITRFNINNLISELTIMIQPQADQKSLKIDHLNNNKEISITSDLNKCRHILQNLLGNAVKFTEKGKVEISATENEKVVIIKVIDTGIGITESQQMHIFDEFRQADGSTSRKYGGTGLGLAIAKKYSNLLGGTVTVISSPGNGSEFTLTLPKRLDAENNLIKDEPDATFKNSLQRIKPFIKPNNSESTILLVEDSEPAVVQIKDFMEESGYRILVAHDGREALEIINNTIPDAMILDLMMPDVDGFQLLKTLREAEPTANIPVLILTAKHITSDELKFLKRNNIHQLIQKGDVNRNELLNSVSSMVNKETKVPELIERKKQNIKGKPVVLVVEDNPDNMTTVKAIMADDFTVIEAVDGFEGVEMAKKHKPNLILMDIELPGMDGIKAFKTIRNDTRLQHIPVIALTASAMTTERETILAYGLDAYIAKPINEKDFFKTINEVLYGK